MKVSVIFHSVSANTYLCAKEICGILSDEIGKEKVGIYRVRDRKIDFLKTEFPIVLEYYEEIMNIPLVNNDIVKDSDVIIMGSPTYFGNVSAQLKDFLDDTSVFWENAELYGKRFLAFATAGNSAGGADVCLKTLDNYAQHMGMVVLPVPSNLSIKMPAYGLVHYSGDLGDNRPGINFKKAAEECLKSILNIL